MHSVSTLPAAFEYADDTRVYRTERAAHEGQRVVAERLVALLIHAVGGPFVQRKPTRAECRTESLDYFAEKWRARWPGFRQHIVRARLEQLGITQEQVAQWATAEETARDECACDLGAR